MNEPRTDLLTERERDALAAAYKLCIFGDFRRIGTRFTATPEARAKIAAARTPQANLF